MPEEMSVVIVTGAGVDSGAQRVTPAALEHPQGRCDLFEEFATRLYDELGAFAVFPIRSVGVMR